MSAPVLRTLLAGAIDYAGLFPPAALPMGQAVRNYAAYRASADAWALGRFVVPAARLAEFRECAGGLLPPTGAAPWRVSALAGPAGGEDWEAAERFEQPGVRVDALEVRAARSADVASAAARRPNGVDVFFEIPIEPDPAALIDEVAAVGGRVKVRTGGITADAFPTSRNLARFIVACVRSGVPFKATAGLHHPLRATYPLTYDPESARGDMFGFINVLLAGAFAREGMAEPAVAEVLNERAVDAIRFAPSTIEWRGHRIGIDAVARARHAAVLSIGSCSFREPIDELSALGLL